MLKFKDKELRQLDKRLANILMYIANKLGVSKDELRLDNVDYAQYFRMANEFARNLEGNGRLLNINDRAELDKEIQTAGKLIKERQQELKELNF